MKRAELALRKELALAHLDIARKEMELDRAQRTDSLAVVCSAVDLASTIFAQRDFGVWGPYVRIALSVAHVVLEARRLI
jgi:hypothetical protein